MKYFRTSVEYELRHGVDFDDQLVAWVIPAIMGMSDPEYSPLTLAKLKKIPDEILQKCLKKFKHRDKKDSQGLSWCANCGAQEMNGVELSRCKGCRNVAYCGWKIIIYCHSLWKTLTPFT